MEPPSTIDNTLDHITVLPPWERTAHSLEKQLYREVTSFHPLYGIDAYALARRGDNDDVLYALSNAQSPLAVVHLTWKDNDFPFCQFYASVEDWADHRMKPDHEEYEKL